VPGESGPVRFGDVGRQQVAPGHDACAELARKAFGVGIPPFCSYKIPMICFSVNRDCFIVRLLAWTDSAKNWRKFRGSGHSVSPLINGSRRMPV
jgi:hypothetical protein